jgi:glycosyltransferase involved in cell wall biosynthesis
MKLYEKEYWSKFDGVFAITPEEAAMMRSMGYKGLLDIAPAGVDTIEFSPNPHQIPHKNTLCYIGGMDWQPNIEAVTWFVEKVFPTIQQQYPSLEVHIAGKRMPPHLRAYHTHKGVTMHPDVPSASAFLQAHEILVVPLLSGGGMRLKIVEAMALGMPIVSTRIGAEGIAAVHRESIMFADTPEEFAHAISELHTQPELRKKIAEKARTIALQQYSWESIAERMTQFYERVITERRQRM